MPAPRRKYPAAQSDSYAAERVPVASKPRPSLRISPEAEQALTLDETIAANLVDARNVLQHSFEFNGVRIRVDKASTHEGVKAKYRAAISNDQRFVDATGGNV